MGSLLVFDPSKLRLENGENSDLRSASSEAVVGIVTERGGCLRLEATYPLVRRAACGCRAACSSRYFCLRIATCSRRQQHQRAARGPTPPFFEMRFLKLYWVHPADYLTKVVVSGKSSKQLKVSEIMTKEEVLKTVSPADTVLAAMELMIDYNFRHVPVVSLRGGARGCSRWSACALRYGPLHFTFVNVISSHRARRRQPSLWFS